MGGLKGLGAHILPALAVFQIGAAEAEGLQAFGKILRRQWGMDRCGHNGIDGPAAVQPSFRRGSGMPPAGSGPLMTDVSGCGKVGCSCFG
ncbi:hypothetical protein [Neisseria gonorrhoeae]|uniref:hypothetical protein n=1 Tax=Neisseria gonorrhoeae TaxID=485 RepID=UPI00272AEB4D|nr:hypothetical protein [Neisseria gonorrhoeae]WLF14430.1 hypothetical protein Q6379_09525 [Neisseria gonorrhoeae]